MKDIVLQAVIGDEIKEVHLSCPHGGGGNHSYHIMIDNFFHGTVTKTLNGWHVYANANSWLSLDDCEVLLEAVQNNFES